MTKFKKIAASIMVAVTLATSATGAISASAAKERFYFSLGDRGQSGWSEGNEKDDNEQTAYIHTETGSVTSTAYEYFTLYKTQNATTANKLSDSKKISSLGAAYTIPYTTYRGTGSISYIHASSSYYGSSVSGYWYA
jgi:hypothetical protein